MFNYLTDLEIIILHRQYRQYTQDYDLKKPVWLGDTRYQLQPESLFEGKINIFLPAGFMDLPDETAQVKYPSGNRPHIIKTNAEQTVNFTFQFVGEIGFPLSIPVLSDEINRSFPCSVIYDTGTFINKDLEIIWLEYKSFSIEKEVYNLLFPIMTNDAGLILGSFNCPFTSYDIWKPCVLQIIKSIHGKEDTDERI